MKKPIALLLCSSFLLLTLVSCGDSGDGGGASVDSTAAQTSSADETVTETAAETESYNAPEIKDFGGYEFRVMSDIVDMSGVPILYAEEMNGEAVNDALYSRDRELEEKYNVDVTFIEKSADTISTSVKAGDDICDVTFPNVPSMFTMAQEGYLLDYNSIDSIDLSNPWWDQRIISGYSVKGKTYCMTGDYTLRNPMTEFVLQYNKQIYENYGFDDPYQMVWDGKWTFDSFWGMAKQVSSDLNGDGAMDANDMWGFITEISAPYYFFIGGGNKPLEQTDDGYRITLGDEKIVSALENSLFFAVDGQNALCVDDGKFQPTSGNSVWQEAYRMFTSDQALFRSSALGDILEYREMKMDYGILPIPMASEAQDGYYCLVSAWDSPMVIPITVSDPERTGLLVEALGWLSHDEVKSVFFDTLLSGKLMRDDESIEMLDLITQSKTYDIEWTINLTGIFSITTDIAKNKTDNLTSKLASIEEKSQAKLDKFLAAFDD